MFANEVEFLCHPMHFWSPPTSESPRNCNEIVYPSRHPKHLSLGFLHVRDLNQYPFTMISIKSRNEQQWIFNIENLLTFTIELLKPSNYVFPIGVFLQRITMNSNTIDQYFSLLITASFKNLLYHVICKLVLHHRLHH